MGHVPSRELRKRLREGGKKWKAVERMAAKARKETEPFLAELAGMAVEVERAARQLSRSLIEPVSHRPFEEEIADCKQAIVAFLKREESPRSKPVWLGPPSGHLWRQMETRKGKRPDRGIPGHTPPVYREDKDPKGSQIVMERAKLGWFRMLQKPEK